MGKSWSRREPSAGRGERRSRFNLFRSGRDAEPETAWTFQLPRPDFVAGSYEGRTFLQPANHLGEDSAHGHHDAIHAIANGVVRYSGRATGYGRVVVVEHRLPDGVRLCSIYGHLCGHSGYPLVPNGSAVAPGDVVGYIGDAQENGDGLEHLHLGLRKGAYDGTFCGYVRHPECTPKHYEVPTEFIAKRSGRMRLVAGLEPSAATPRAGERVAFEATVRNDHYYGGKFDFRIRFQPESGEPAFSAESAKRMAPSAEATLRFEQEFDRAAPFQATLEVKAPGTVTWSAVEPSGAGPVR